MITREFLENEIQTLEVQKEQHLAAANAAGGAIEGFKYLISQLEQPEQEVVGKDKDALSFQDLEKLTGMKVKENAKKEKETNEDQKRSKS